MFSKLYKISSYGEFEKWVWSWDNKNFMFCEDIIIKINWQISIILSKKSYI